MFLNVIHGNSNTLEAAPSLMVSAQSLKGAMLDSVAPVVDVASRWLPTIISWSSSSVRCPDCILNCPSLTCPSLTCPATASINSDLPRADWLLLGFCLGLICGIVSTFIILFIFAGARGCSCSRKPTVRPDLHGSSPIALGRSSTWRP